MGKLQTQQRRSNPMYRRLFPMILALLFMLAGSAVIAFARQIPMPPAAIPIKGGQIPPGTSGGVGNRPLSPVGSGFTYQGRLAVSSSPANGQYDLQFTLFDALSGGNQVGSPVTVISQTVNDGLFTVQLDF